MKEKGVVVGVGGAVKSAVLVDDYRMLVAGAEGKGGDGDGEGEDGMGGGDE